jgi:hypothetical protein
MNNNIIIIGCNLIGLYSAIKCVDNGLRVSIMEKKYNCNNDDSGGSGGSGGTNGSNSSNGGNGSNNYRIFSKHHTIYIQLLNRFSINYSKYILKYNEKTLSILKNVINKSKHIPKKSLNMLPFDKFCSSILSPADYNILISNIDNFEYIYNNISAMCAISIFTHEINNTNEYFIVTDSIDVLLERMVVYLTSRGVVFYYNLEVREINYNNNKKVYISTKYNTYSADIIILTLSKNNLFRMKFLNKDQKKLLNCVSKYFIDTESIYCDNYLQKENGIKTYLLDNVHVVCPIRKYTMYIWNIGTNNIMIREKIKMLFQYVYICSESYSKNAFFVNYSLETFDDIYGKVLNKMSNISYITNN